MANFNQSPLNQVSLMVGTFIDMGTGGEAPSAPTQTLIIPTTHTGIDYSISSDQTNPAGTSIYPLFRRPSRLIRVQ
jgi:hypothetical protein